MTVRAPLGSKEAYQRLEKSKVLALVGSALAEVNRFLPVDRQLEARPETELYGPGGGLDSMALVSLIVALEEQLAEECGVVLTLASEKALSLMSSPFGTVDTLAEYVLTLARERSAAAS